MPSDNDFNVINDNIYIKEVRLTGTLKSIGDYAFYEYKRLTSITIPDSIISIGSDNFASCQNLSAITVAAGNEYYIDVDGVLFDNAKTTLVQYPAEHYETVYIIPAGVTIIGSGAFSSCSKLTGITIPAGVTRIESSVFSYCSSLTSITILGSVNSIGDSAFKSCEGLTSITIPSSVNNIDDFALSAATVLQE